MCVHLTFIRIMSIFFLLMFIFVLVTDFVSIKCHKYKTKSNEKEKYKI